MLSSRRSWRHRLPEAALLILVAYAFLMLVATPGLIWTPDRFNDLDEGQHFYALDRLAKGQVPYVDFYYLYGPSTLYSLYIPFKLCGENLSSSLFAVRVWAPILSLLLVYLVGRLVLRTSRGRLILMASVVAANAHTLYWCPGYRTWLNLLAIAGFAGCLFRPPGLASFLWGVVISLGAAMSADMTVMMAACLMIMVMFAAAAGGVRTIGKPLIICLAGILSGTLLLWSAPLFHSGLERAVSLHAALLDGTNWYGGLPLPWPWEIFAAPLKIGIIKGFISIYLYFTLLMGTVAITLIWILRRGSDQDLLSKKACSLGLVVASLVLARVVLGRVNEFDFWRIGYASGPLLILMAMFFEHFAPQFARVLRERFPNRRIAGFADIFMVAVAISVGAGLAFVPFFSILQGGRATLYSIIRQINPPGPTVLVSGVRCPTSGFWSEYAGTYAYLREHSPPGAYLYVCPWGPYNALLNLPNPTRVDVLDNVAPNPHLRREMVTDLMRLKPEYIVLRRAWDRKMSASNNPEMVTREIRTFTEQYYTQEAQFDLDTVWRRKDSPGERFKPEVVKTWTEVGPFMPKSPGARPFDNLLAFKMAFPQEYEADTVELKLKVSYPIWARSLAKGRLRLKTDVPLEESNLGIPSDGQTYAIRYYLNRIMPLRQVEFELDHHGLFNFAPSSIQIQSLSLYRSGGRAFE
jgi:hypothetical protein